jgi:hypothetical protein
VSAPGHASFVTRHARWGAVGKFDVTDAASAIHARALAEGLMTRTSGGGARSALAGGGAAGQQASAHMPRALARDALQRRGVSSGGVQFGDSTFDTEASVRG